MSGNLISKIFKSVRALATRKVLIECDRIPYEFNKVPLKKIINWICVEASITIRSRRPWGWPTHLQIEPDSHCNLRCVICPVTTGMGRKIGSMDFDLFKKIIDEMSDYLFLIILWDWGEPFLNPSIYEMISYAKSKGIKVVSSTNGHIFKQVAHADRVVRSGLDTLIMALDGITQETYELYRQGGRISTVIQGIETVVARKRELNSTTPFINLRFVPMRHNEHEISKLKELARSLGVDALTLKTMNPYTDGDELVPVNTWYRRFRYLSDDKTRIRRNNNPCKQLWNNPVVHWNGAVCLCTYDFEEKYKLGNLKNEKFRDIWFGHQYLRLRRQFRSDWEKIDICRECSYAYEGGSCIDEIVADAFFFSPKTST